MKHRNGSISFGKEGKSDATFIMLDDHFLKFFAGKFKPQNALMNRKMKIKGNMVKAMKLNPCVFFKGANVMVEYNFIEEFINHTISAKVA